MLKKGVYRIAGNTSPTVGVETLYAIAEWYPDTPILERNPAKVSWELFRKRNDGKFTSTGIKKVGISSFTFGEKSWKYTYRLEAYLHTPEGKEPMSLIVKPQKSEISRINKVELYYVDDTKGKTFSFLEKAVAKAHCVHLANEELLFTLWEDDSKGGGHDPKNLLVATKKAKVKASNGIATAEFSLTEGLMKKAMRGEHDGQLEFYVTVEYFKNKKHESENININNPLYKKPQEVKPVHKQPANHLPKVKGSPAEHKPKSKKEEKGILDKMWDAGKELFDFSESEKAVATKDKEATQNRSVTNSPVVVNTKLPKQKFEKVIGLGEEAIIYVTNEIATPIKIDKNNNLISYPDSGKFNGMDTYYEGNNIYCKKISDFISAFPTYKAFIYRGYKKGEAKDKLKQDLNNNTHENAESIILEVARHSGSQNINILDQGGPIPSSTLNKMFRIKYKIATNTKGKTSYRYRIVDDTMNNFPLVKDIKNEISNGDMSILGRSSISIDPWNSKGLIGCLGIRGSGGNNHPSYANEIKDQSANNYKNIYHSLNNYLESIIPELTGVYGRRGYSSDGKVPVLTSKYTKEVNVFVLIDPLKELNNCSCNLKKDGRKEFYEEFGSSAIAAVKNRSKANKFKGLYLVAQRRQENGLKRKVPNNNPMNIKSSGDLGKKDLYTREVINGKEIYINDGFGSFSTIEKGFEGYLNLLQNNYVSAYQTLIDDDKTIKDFTNGLQLHGKYGAYATDPEYIIGVQTIFKGVVNDYRKLLECKLCSEKNTEKKNEIKKELELLNLLK